jgi:hypothetical protein
MAAAVAPEPVSAAEASHAAAALSRLPGTDTNVQQYILEYLLEAEVLGHTLTWVLPSELLGYLPFPSWATASVSLCRWTLNRSS